MKRVVITGMGALTPIGNNVAEYWQSLTKGTSGAALITKFDPTHFKTKFACELKNFNAADHLDRNEIRKNDSFVQYALIAAEEAIKNAQINLDQIDRRQMGVIWASGNGGFTTFEEQVTEFATGDGVPRYNPFFIPKTLANMASGMISIKFGLRGMNFTTVSACAASNTAIMDAFNYIRWGKAKVFVTGGSEAAIAKAGIGSFGSMKALSTRNDNPATASRPFDKERDGFVMGEGAGALILEEYEHAVNRGATIIAEVAGTAMTADAYHMSATHPEGEGAKHAMQLALEEAGLSASDVDYINAHATSTPVGDLSEIQAIRNLFKEDSPNVMISSTKSMTGHLLGAAGAIEAIACILSIKHGVIPPTINTTDLDRAIPADEINIVLNNAVEKDVNVAMSNNFGFGGHNAIAIFKKF
jgi:3-oxoacyl-[acyl-carrier-protein] synthase II